MIGLVVIFIVIALLGVLANDYGAESRDGWIERQRPSTSAGPADRRSGACWPFSAGAFLRPWLADLGECPPVDLRAIDVMAG